MAADQTLKLRIAEIIHSANGEITEREAIKAALVERYGGDYEALLDYATTATRGAVRALRRQTYELPESQGFLFDVPEVISNRGPEGYTFIARDAATVGHVRQWIKEARQYHATQKTRFDKAAAELEEATADADPAQLWTDFRVAIAQGEAA